MIKAVRSDSHPFIHSKEAFAKALLNYRERHGVSQEALAAKVGVGESTIKNWERQRTKLAARLLPKLKFLLPTSDVG